MSFDGDAGVAVMGDSLPILKGRQFQIMWLGSATGGAPAEFGGALPAPGRAFVSPSLLEDAGGADGMERRFGVAVDDRNSGVQWDRLTAFSGEYLAFATLPGGRELPAKSRLLGFDSAALGASVADSPASPAEFQLPVGPVAVPFWIDERVPTPTSSLVGGFFLLVVPATAVLTLGVSSRSELRTQRRGALAYLGAGRRALSVLDAVETATISVPTVLVASAAMWVMLGRMTRPPAGSVQYLKGDLRPTAPAAIAAVAAVVFMPILVGAVAPRVSAWRSRRRRRLAQWSGPVLLFVPVAVSVAAPMLPTESRAVPFLLVCLSVVAVVPRASIGVLPHLGVLVAGPRSAARLVAGRRLQWGDLRASALMRVTTFAVVIVVVVSSISLNMALPSKASGLPPGIVSLAVPGGATSAEMSGLTGREPSVAFVTVSAGRVFADKCEGLAELVRIDPGMCGTNPDHVLSLAAASQLGRLGSITFGAPRGDAAVDQLIARVGSAAQHEALQANANAVFGPSQVLGWEQLGPNPIVGWTTSLGLAAVLLFGAALVLLVVNIVRFPSASDRALQALSASDRTQRRVMRWGCHTVVVCGALLGAGYGLLVNSAGQPAQITSVEQWPLVLAVLLVGLTISAIIEVGVVVAVRGLGRRPRAASQGKHALAELEAVAR